MSTHDLDFVNQALARHRAAYEEMHRRAAAYCHAFRPPSFLLIPSPEAAELVEARSAYLLARDRFNAAHASLHHALETETVLKRSGKLLAASAKLADDEIAADEPGESRLHRVPTNFHE
jgi:hypothetical protein